MVYNAANVDPIRQSNRLAAMALLGVVQKLVRRRDLAGLRKHFNAAVGTVHFKSRDLMFNFGNGFLQLGDVASAMRAYGQFVEIDPGDGRFHCGKKLLDYLEDDPTVDGVTVIVSELAGVEGYEVPDLVVGIFNAVRKLNDEEGVDIHLPEQMYRALPPLALNNMGDKLLSSGDAEGALRYYLHSIRKLPDDALLRLQVGVTYFLAGRYQDAERHWSILSATRQAARERLGLAGSRVRFLGDSFFPAIGHTAYIDTYIKSVKLGWREVDRIVAPVTPQAKLPGQSILRYLTRYVEQIAYPVGRIDDIVETVGLKRALQDAMPGTDTQIRIALTDDFWYGPSADGTIKWFAPHGAEVEKAWKERSNGPLFSITDKEQQSFRASMEQVFGLPRDAWFVGLHVRTPGFHQKWHDAHPGTRNAEIETYRKVIDWIIAQGGWVVRLGDANMPPYEPCERVIDYATSEYRNPDLDVLFCATCSYFVGTNSGLSVVPAMFGRPCALTNWSPVAIPNWYLDDVYVPKLVREKSTGRLLSFREMFSSVYGWSQFEKDYVESGMEIVENDPEDLMDATLEIHQAVMGGLRIGEEDEARIARFNAIAVENNGFVGSRISARFLKRYEHLLD